MQCLFHHCWCAADWNYVASWSRARSLRPIELLIGLVKAIVFSGWQWNEARKHRRRNEFRRKKLLKQVNKLYAETSSVSYSLFFVISHFKLASQHERWNARASQKAKKKPNPKQRARKIKRKQPFECQMNDVAMIIIVWIRNTFFV